MNAFNKFLKLKPEDDAPAGGDTASPAEQQNPPASGETPEAEGDKYDDLGYEKAPAEKVEPVKETSDKKEDPVKKSEEVVTDPASGYGDEPPKVEPEVKETEKKPDPEPTEKDDIDKAIGEDLPKEEAKAIKDFATKNKMTPDQVKAYSEMRREEMKAAEKHAADQEKEYKNEQIRRRAAWHEELKADKEFGGENFKLSLTMVERVLTDHMPATKKMLTEHKGILPPYLMRDIAKIGQLLHPKERLVTGDAKVPKADEASDDPLDFYE